MTDVQQRFVDEYCLDCNGAAAARRAGYAGENTKQIAYELLNNQEIALAVKEKLDNMTMKVEVAVKHLSDVASTRLNDYFIIKDVQAREQTEQYVTVLLESVREEIQVIRDYLRDQGIEKDWQGPFLEKIEALQKQELEYHMDIVRYGNDVTRLVAGRPVVMQVAELDLVALAKANDLGRIKNYSVGKDGVKVEMYAADAAAKSILEFHGKLIKKHEITFPEIDKLSPEELEQLSKLQQAIQSK